MIALGGIVNQSPVSSKQMRRTASAFLEFPLLLKLHLRCWDCCSISVLIKQNNDLLMITYRLFLPSTCTANHSDFTDVFCLLSLLISEKLLPLRYLEIMLLSLICSFSELFCLHARICSFIDWFWLDFLGYKAQDFGRQLFVYIFARTFGFLPWLWLQEMDFQNCKCLGFMPRPLQDLN